MNPMKVLKYILGMTCVYNRLWMNESEIRKNERSRLVFAKEGSLVKVSYIEPSFWEVLMSSPWYQGLKAYERIIWTMLYANKQYVMYCVQYIMYDDAYYSHNMNFLIRLFKVYWLEFS